MAFVFGWTAGIIPGIRLNRILKVKGFSILKGIANGFDQGSNSRACREIAVCPVSPKPREQGPALIQQSTFLR
jgi:hypothetical protein